jgi:hypothetical protein
MKKSQILHSRAELPYFAGYLLLGMNIALAGNDSPLPRLKRADSFLEAP